MNELDLFLFFALHNLSGQSALVDGLIVLVGQYALYLVLAMLAFFFIRALQQKKISQVYGGVSATVVALIARFGVAEVLYALFQRPRPYVAFDISHLLSSSAFSFPSGHTVFLFALATGMYGVHKTFSLILFGVAALVGVARVMGGAHYPSDILAGAVLGTLIGGAGIIFLKKITKH
ncbi:MAG: phosphatase PAP2 family protein [Patescibacteria group bacterium]